MHTLLIDAVSRFGAAALMSFWLPLAMWTVAAAAAVLVLRRTGRILHPAYQYHARLALLLALPLGLLTMPLIDFDLPRMLHRQVILSFTSADLLPQPPAPTAGLAAATPGPADGAWTLYTWVGLATLGLLPFLAVRVLRLVSDWLALRDLRHNLLVTDHTMLDYKARMMDIGRPIVCAVTPDDTTPMTFGWLRPVVVVPARLFEDEAKLDTVLTHELVHVARYDYVFRCIERLLTCALGFNPVVHVLVGEIDRYREMSCDAEVLLRTVTTKKAYATLLQEMLPRTNGADLSMAIVDLPGQLRARIVAMKRYTLSPGLHQRILTASTKVAVVLGVGLTLLVASSESVAYAPRFIQSLDAPAQPATTRPIERDDRPAHVRRAEQFAARMDRLPRHRQLERIGVSLDEAGRILNGIRQDAPLLAPPSLRLRLQTFDHTLYPLRIWLTRRPVSEHFPMQRARLAALMHQRRVLFRQIERDTRTPLLEDLDL